jgi:diketogulonate reductase-like aldo/keto reductase
VRLSLTGCPNDGRFHPAPDCPEWERVGERRMAPSSDSGRGFIDDDVVNRVVREAVEIGYRNVDTAQSYGNESGVGEAIRSVSSGSSCSSRPRDSSTST